MRGCWNWQTGRLEVPVFEKTYGFKSHAPHQIYGDVLELAYIRVLEALAERIRGSTPLIPTNMSKSFSASCIRVQVPSAAPIWVDSL